MAPQSEIQPTTEHDEKSSSCFPDTKAAGWDANTLKGNPHGRIDKAERVREMFTAIAHAYDINNRVHSFWLDQSWRRRAVRLADPVRGASVLDVACGTGLELVTSEECVARISLYDVTRMCSRCKKTIVMLNFQDRN